MLSQKDLDFIRKNQGSINPKKTTVSKSKRPNPFATLDVTATPQQLVAAAGESHSLGADAGGFIAGLATENPAVGAAVREVLNNISDPLELPGEDAYMKSLGYTGAGFSLSALKGAFVSGFTGKSDYNRDHIKYFMATRTDEQMLSINKGRKETPEEKMRRKTLRLRGSGDYSLSSNSLISGGGEGQEANIMPAGPRTTRVIYREYLGDVFTHPTVAGAFYVTSYDINPGLLSTFPWLAPIAQQFEQWTPNGIVFEFRSTSSEYVATQALGSVIMATEYDQLDAVYANKAEMLNSAFANEKKPSCSILHGVECAKADRPLQVLYTRALGVPSGADIRDYDCGRFSIATQGGATANLNLGSLYVHYDITFRKEQLYNGIAAKGLLWDTIYTASGSPTIGSATPLPSVLSGSNRAAGGYPMMTVNNAGTTITLPAWLTTGRWRIEYQLQGSATTSGGTLSCTTNCAVPTTAWSTGSANQYQAKLALGTTYCYMYIVFDVTGPNAVITASAFTITGPVTYGTLSLSQVGGMYGAPGT